MTVLNTPSLSIGYAGLDFQKLKPPQKSITARTRGGFAQIAVNHEPDFAGKGWNSLMDLDEVAVLFPEKAGQAGHTDTGSHSN